MQDSLVKLSKALQDAVEVRDQNGESVYLYADLIALLSLLRHLNGLRKPIEVGPILLLLQSFLP